MARRPANLPDFGNPPLTEFLMGVQFEPLSLSVVDLVCLWQDNFKSPYPAVEQRPAIAGRVETFGKGHTVSQTFELRLDSGDLRLAPAPVRLWALNESGGELLQLQNDRFIRNWRKGTNTGAYPRYELLKRRFKKDFQTFLRAVQRWGSPSINQCEITYINTLGPVPEVGEELHRSLGKFINGWHGEVDVAGCQLEGVALNMSWVDRDPAKPARPPARLRSSVTPAYTSSGDHAFQMALSYRGAPEGNSPEAVMDFMGRGRERIVKAFAEMTTEEMHEIWQRKV